MKIAVHGCTHGDLDLVYTEIIKIQQESKQKVDLLICCGDFQAVRDEEDLQTMAVPKKFRKLKDFPSYYNGEKKAPVLTLVIGGNHEAASHMIELPYGGWLAHNIYYLGYAGIVNVSGLRIAGLSGIYDRRDFNRGHYERPPFNESTKRSFYHVRNIDTCRLKKLPASDIDIFLSHDWPSNIQLHGDVEEIYQQKPQFRDEPLEPYLKGNDPAEELMNLLKPRYWFAAHHHCTFSAVVNHEAGEKTLFKALGKCKTDSDFLHVFDIDTKDNVNKSTLQHDKEWISILKRTDSFTKRFFSLKEFTAFENIEKDMQFSYEKEIPMEGDFNVEPFASGMSPCTQTKEFCSRFSLIDPLTCLLDKDF